jgi:hypothetical protein
MFALTSVARKLDSVFDTQHSSQIERLRFYAEI